MDLVKGLKRDFEPRPIHKILEENKAFLLNPNPALILKNESEVTYSELDTRASQYARVISDLIAGKISDSNEIIVAVCLPPSEKLIEVLLAIWKVGAAYLPLDAAFPKARVTHILEEARPVLLIHEGLEISPDINGILIDDLDLEANKTSEKSFSTKESSLAIVMYTSGSTGKPKGVKISHKQILNRLNWQFEKFPYAHDETHCVFKTALTFVDSVCEIWGPLMNGKTLIIVPKNVSKDPELLVGLLEEYNIQRLVLVPTLLKSILTFLKIQNTSRALASLKTWFCSGEELQLSLAMEFCDHFQSGPRKLCNLYGSTEIMADVTYYTIYGREQLLELQKIPIGRPIHNTGIILLDENQRPVEEGAVGEIFVSGLNVSEGYLKSEGEGKFIPNPFSSCPNHQRLFRTGDFGLFKDGLLYYEGRTDSQVKIRGHRVDLSEVQLAVQTVNGVLEAVVLCQNVTEVDKTIVAFVRLSEEFTASGLKAELKASLPDYMLPEVFQVESVPLLISGKVDRQALLQKFASSKPLVTNGFSGTSDQAAALFQTVAEVLGAGLRASIDESSNFYDIGGNSLNSVLVVAELRKRGLQISVTDFVGAKNMGEVLDKLVRLDSVQNPENPEHGRYKIVPLSSEHKDISAELIAKGFSTHSIFDKYTNVQMSDYIEAVHVFWDFLFESKHLSFVVEDENGKVIGVSLNHDIQEDVDLQIDNNLASFFEFLHFVEEPARKNQLPQGLGHTLFSLTLAVHEDLSPQENVALVLRIEQEVIEVARRNNFSGVCATNVSPLTQQLANHQLGYETLLEYHINQFVTESGERPYQDAPDSEYVLVQYKKLSKGQD